MSNNTDLILSETIYLRALSPVHIGTGEALEPLDYVVQVDKFYRISQKQFDVFLRKEQWDSSFLELTRAYSQWIKDELKTINELQTRKTFQGKSLRGADYNQTLSRLRQNFNLYEFCKQVERKDREGKLRGFAEAFLGFLKQNQEAYPIHGQQIKAQIRGMEKNGLDQAPYLPGSSLKGALRTVLLFQLFQDNGNDFLGDNPKSLKESLLQDISQNLQARGSRHSQALEMGRSIEYASYCGHYDENRKRFNYKDEQYDLFKFLRVADAHPKEPGQAKIAIASADLYVSSLVKKYRDDKGERMATKQRQAPGLEVIEPGSIFETQVFFDIKGLWEVYKLYLREEKRYGKAKHWLGLPEKSLALFGIDLRSVQAKNLASSQDQFILHLENAMSRFARAQLDFETTWLNKQYLSYPLDKKADISEAGIRQPFERLADFPFDGSSLLRLGFAAGFSGHTLLLYLLNDPDLRESFRKVMQKLELGKRPGPSDGKPYLPQVERFPKSRTLVSFGQQIMPIGWIEWVKVGNDERIFQEHKWVLESLGVVKGASPSPQAETQKQEKEPEFLPSNTHLRKSLIVDAKLIATQGRQKKFKLFLEPGMYHELTISYVAELETDPVYRIELNLNKGGIIVSGSFRGKK